MYLHSRRLDDIGHNGLDLISDVKTIFDIHGLDTQIIAASIRHPQHVTEAALRGAHIGTMPLKVIHALTKHPLTDKGIEQFWQTGINNGKGRQTVLCLFAAAFVFHRLIQRTYRC